MNKKIARLVDLLSSYQEESENLSDIIAHYSLPLLLKIAQEQLALFPEQTDKQKEESPLHFGQTNYDTFSFQQDVGSFGMSESSAKFLDKVLARLKAAEPNKTSCQVIKEMQRAIYNYGDASVSYFQSRSDIFAGDTKKRILAKWLEMFPDLKWTPGNKQMSLPIEGVPESIQLGGDPRHFEGLKYTDFTPSNNVDLLSPKFKVNLNFGNKKEASINEKLSRFSTKFEKLGIKNCDVLFADLMC